MTPVLLTVALSVLGAAEPALLVGGHAHGAANIRILADLGVGNFVWIPKQGYGMGNTPWNAENNIHADVEACVRHGLHFMISQRRGLGRDYKPGGGEFGGDTTPDIYDAATVRRIAHAAGGLFVGLHAEELDVDFLQNGLRAGWRTRLPGLYDFTDRAGGRRAFEAELRRIARASHAAGARFMPNMAVSLHHSGFRAGGDIVMAELLEALPCVELQLAYLRGGATQFAKPWGVWVSPWHRGKVLAEDKTLWPGPNSAAGAGHDPTRLRRSLFLSWASGARVLTVQETEPLFSGDGKGGYRLAAWGRELKRFWDFVKANPEPLKPLSPLALMVDVDSGWAPGHLHGDWIEHETVWAKLQPDRSDAMLAGYLDALLPGFERSAGWWKEGGSEYPGYFAATPAGPFDIVSSDAPAERLASYRAVVMMGGMEMTPRLLARLNRYVRDGGELHVNVNQMRRKEAFVQDSAFVGATIGQSRAWSDWSRSRLLMRRTASSNAIVLKQPIGRLEARTYEEPWYVAQDVQPKGAAVAATTASGEPVLLRHAYGRGHVWLSTPDYLLAGASRPAPRLGFFASLLSEVASRSSVRVTATDGGSAPDVSWIAARQGGDTVVVAANHSTSAREVVVIVAGHTAARGTIAPGDVGVWRLPGGRSAGAAREYVSEPAAR